jgi:hypothetical protein
MYTHQDSIYIEDDDNCVNCHHYKKKITCPLIEALGTKIVTMPESFYVKHCGFYKEFRNPLKIVRANETKTNKK